jgi:phospholipid/cholesterol/gamma-HCH transport system substrate-binding protein
MSARRAPRSVPRTAVTAVVTVALVISLIAAATIFLRGGEDTYRVTAFFPRAIGLFERSTVRVLGVEVGRIAEVAPEGDRVRVALDVREDVKIPANASAIIVPISLISDRYVQLSPVWRGGPALQPGDEIPLSRGVAPAELDDLLATLKRFLEALEPGTPTEPGALGRFVQNADKALAGRGAQLGETIDTLATLLDVLGRNVSSVDSIITNLDRLFTTLSTHDDALRATNRGLGTVMSSLADQEGALEAGTGNLASLVAELGSLVREHRSDLDEDLAILADVSEVLHRQRDRILANVIWLPVLSKGVMNAFDRENLRIIVRDATPGIKP